jgi:hypothetical protein
MKPRGMRDVPTAQTLTQRGQAKGREQAITDLARLEHEKARLERELTVWTTKQVATVKRLEQVRGQLEVLQQQLEYTPVSSPVPLPRRRPAGDKETPAPSADTDEAQPPRLIAWEY